MIQEEQILKELKKYFKDVKLEQQCSRYDFTAVEKMSGYTLYIRCSSQDTRLNTDYSWGGMLINSAQDCVMNVIQIGGKYYFSVVAFMDDNKVFIKSYVDYKALNKENVWRLGWQLKAQYNQINLLPTELLRVEKTISLNDSELIEGSVKYVRKFRPNYKMEEEKQPLSQSEHFKRLIYGTPEINYPSDDLDKKILRIVRQVYPNASVKSKLMIFDNDLLFYRREVDKQKQDIEYSIYDSSIPQNEQQKKTLTLEVYFYKNVFGRTIINLQQGDVFDTKVLDLLETYEPLSAMIL